MFSYYGAKTKLVNMYPAPIHNTIVEPFAGSARYALKYWDKEVHLFDTSEIVVGIWDYLINASVKDIEALPEITTHGEKPPDYLCKEEKWLLGFAMNRGSSTPKNSCSGWCARDNEIGRHKKRILANLDKIRHWKITLGDYTLSGS